MNRKGEIEVLYQLGNFRFPRFMSAKISYMVLCTFDLKDANSQDYENAYADLEKIGLKRIDVGTRNVVIPTTYVVGRFDGNSAEIVCTDVRTPIQNAFKEREFKSEIFIVVAENGNWCSGTT